VVVEAKKEKERKKNKLMTLYFCKFKKRKKKLVHALLPSS
jgi:hypothetical protein